MIIKKPIEAEYQSDWLCSWVIMCHIKIFVISNTDNLFLILEQFVQLKDRWKWVSLICFCFKLDLAFEIFHIECCRMTLLLNIFLKSTKEVVGGGGSENSGKNPLSYTRCICGWSLNRILLEKHFSWKIIYKMMEKLFSDSFLTY